jgi:hypothetical protein
MTSFNKKELLSGLHDRVELIRNNLQPFLRLPEEHLLKSPAPGKWSIAEIFEHLNIVHGGMLQSIAKAMHKAPINSRESFSSGWIGGKLYQWMMPRADGTVLKMKTPRRFHAGPAPLSSRKVLDTFLSQLDEFDHVLELCVYVDLQKIKLSFAFPRGLKLRLGDGLRFIVAHCERHLLQARHVQEQVQAKTDK